MENQQSDMGSARDTGQGMAKDQAGSRGGAMVSGGASSGAGGSGSMGSAGAGSQGAQGGGASMGAGAGDGGDRMSQASSTAHRTIDQMAQSAQPMVDRLANAAHAGVDRMTGMLSGTSQSVSERSRQINDAYQNLAESTREYVRQKPGASLLMAVGAGFILARLFGNRR